jgi:hypothetical protein
MTAVLAHHARAATHATVGTTTITGTISDPKGYPLAGITVRLYDDGAHDGSLVDTTTTDDAGCYRFTTVLTDDTDRYRFEADDMTGNHVSNCSPAFTVMVGIIATHDLTLKVAGIIQGKVASGNQVFVTAEGKRWCGEAGVASNGAFRLAGLPAGTYTVSFHDPSETFDLPKVKVTAGKTTTLKPQAFSSRRPSGSASSRS